MYRTSCTAVLGLLTGTLFLLVGQSPDLGGRQALAQSSKETKAVEKSKGGKPTDDESIAERLTASWTCAMHPHVRQAESGKCPICSMDLISLSHYRLHQEDRAELDAVTARAVQESPEVRAAQARLRLAEAELQQARFQALQRIITQRRERRRQQAELQAAEAELRQAEQAASSQGKNGNAGRLVDAARQRVNLLRRELAETDALLSLAAGHRPLASATLDERRRATIEKELLPKAQAALKTAKEAYQTGEIDLDELLTWSRRVAELKVQLARTAAERRAAFDSLRKVLEAIRDVAEARHRAGQASITDVLDVDYRLTELKLELLDRE